MHSLRRSPRLRGPHFLAISGILGSSPLPLCRGRTIAVLVGQLGWHRFDRGAGAVGHPGALTSPDDEA